MYSVKGLLVKIRAESHPESINLVIFAGALL